MYHAYTTTDTESNLCVCIFHCICFNSDNTTGNSFWNSTWRPIVCIIPTSQPMPLSVSSISEITFTVLPQFCTSSSILLWEKTKWSWSHILGGDLSMIYLSFGWKARKNLGSSLTTWMMHIIRLSLLQNSPRQIGQTNSTPHGLILRQSILVFLMGIPWHRRCHFERSTTRGDWDRNTSAFKRPRLGYKGKQDFQD